MQSRLVSSHLKKGFFAVFVSSCSTRKKGSRMEGAGLMVLKLQSRGYVDAVLAVLLLLYLLCLCIFSAVRSSLKP
ncbi:hypothetical protein VNO80_26016 [Phaseolus coccineus]|uniref:Transmembrane protein n=1 Tax=Phaseolus coccineus TaxID=3886 RepID=A0AAN9QP82_PHACN